MVAKLLPPLLICQKQQAESISWEQDGHFFVAPDISAVVEPQRFKERVEGILREIHASALAPNHHRLYYPGEMEALTENRYRNEGLPLNAVTLMNIAEAAERLDVDPALIPWDNQRGGAQSKKGANPSNRREAKES